VNNFKKWVSDAASEQSIAGGEKNVWRLKVNFGQRGLAF
jgi:hypothetical protein